jgi:hypothetical protein
MARRGGGGRVAVGFLLLGVLLAALVFAADRAAARVFEDRASRALQTELSTPGPPVVHIEGFPFLTQLLRQTLTSVHVTADGVAPPGRAGTALGSADVTMRDVTSSDRFHTFHAAQLEGTGTIDYASAKQLTGYPITYAPDGRLKVTIQTQLSGVPVTADIVGRPDVSAADQTLSLADPQLAVAGVDVPDTTAQALLGRLLKPVPISGIPYGLKLSALTATPDGLQAAVSGSDVTFTR